MKPMNFKRLHIKGKCSGILILLVSVFILQGLLTSCAFTWTGYAIGKKIDEKNSKSGGTARIEEAIPNDQSWVGYTKLQIEKTDSTILIGRFQGYGYQSFLKYQPRYEQLRDAIPPITQLPDLETNLTVSFKQNPSALTTGLFEGFNRDGIILSIDGSQKNFNTTDAVRLEDSHGTEYDLNALNRLISSGSAPVRSVVCIKAEHDMEYQIPFDQISYVRYKKNPHSARVAGLLIGGGVDLLLTVLIWTAVVHSIQQH